MIECLPAFDIRNGLPPLCVPLAIQGIERDPLRCQRQIQVVALGDLLGTLKPTARAMKANICRMFGFQTVQTLFMRLPATTELAKRDFKIGFRHW
jgi:hypothetical protein